MYHYSSWVITNWLNSTLIPFWSWVHFNSTNNFLTYFYQMPWKFYDWVNMVFWITENWISILATIFVVAMILIVLFRFTSTYHN